MWKGCYCSREEAERDMLLFGNHFCSPEKTGGRMNRYAWWRWLLRCFGARTFVYEGDDGHGYAVLRHGSKNDKVRTALIMENLGWREEGV